MDMDALQGSPDDVIQMVVALLSYCTPPAGQTVKTPCINCLAT